MNRAAIMRDLQLVRAINIEAKCLRARLRECVQRKASLSMAKIAERHGVSVGAVQSVAHGMGWTDEEKRLSETAPFEVYHIR